MRCVFRTYLYKFQYINLVDSTINYNFNIVFLIIDFVVEIVINITNNFIIIQFVFKYNYTLYNKANY